MGRQTPAPLQPASSTRLQPHPPAVHNSPGRPGTLPCQQPQTSSSLFPTPILEDVNNPIPPLPQILGVIRCWHFLPYSLKSTPSPWSVVGSYLITSKQPAAASLQTSHVRPCSSTWTNPGLPRSVILTGQGLLIGLSLHTFVSRPGDPQCPCIALAAVGLRRCCLLCPCLPFLAHSQTQLHSPAPQPCKQSKSLSFLDSHSILYFVKTQTMWIIKS